MQRSAAAFLLASWGQFSWQAGLRLCWLTFMHCSIVSSAKQLWTSAHSLPAQQQVGILLPGCTDSVSLLQIPKADKAEALYAKYKDAEGDGIGPEGTLQG